MRPTILLGAHAGLRLASDQWGNAAGPWTIERAIPACRVPAGLPDDFRFHDLRHYFASLLIASRLDVKIVQARRSIASDLGAACAPSSGQGRPLLPRHPQESSHSSATRPLRLAVYSAQNGVADKTQISGMRVCVLTP